jgi:hypothetical protein
MSTVAQFELLLAIGISLAALSVVVAILITILHLHHGEELTSWAGPVCWGASVMLFMLGLLVSACAGILWDEPGTYTRQVGIPQAVQIEHLDFLSGTPAYSSVVRVDTDHGIYFLDGYAPIPKAGTVYVVERRKIWGTDTQEFLCLSASLIQCWPVLTDLEWET